MAINFKNDNSEEPIISDINVTPFIDIMLVLLIIFMVTSSVTLQSGLEIDVPKTTSKAPAKENSKAVLISLDTQGGIYVDGERTTKAELEERIKIGLKKTNTTMIILQGDKSSSLQTTLDIIDIAKRAGATQFALAAKQD